MESRSPDSRVCGSAQPPGFPPCSSNIQLSWSKAATLRRKLACAALRSSRGSCQPSITRTNEKANANPFCHRPRNSDSYMLRAVALRALTRVSFSHPLTNTSDAQVSNIRSFSLCIPSPPSSAAVACSSSVGVGSMTCGIWNRGSPFRSLTTMSELLSC